MRKIVVVCLDGCLASGLVGLVDVLSLAQQAIIDSRANAQAFEFVTASPGGRPVRDGRGRFVEVDAALDQVEACQAIVVPGFAPEAGWRPPMFESFSETAVWIRHHHARGALACGSCSGVFLLGEAGLLNGRRCTTTWWLHEEMQRRYPKAKSTWGAALIEDEGVISASGPLSWIDLALYIVRKLCGADAARVAADYAVVDIAPSSRAVYIPTGYLTGSNAFLTEAEYIVRQTMQSPMTASKLARCLSLSGRTLHRRLLKATGESPKQFIDRVRFETAKDLLERTSKPIKQVAAAIGYTDESSFRRTFKRLYGLSPATHRTSAQFGRDSKGSSLMVGRHGTSRTVGKDG